MRDKTQHAAVNGIVQASPVTAYTTEIVKVGYERNRDLPATDPRFLRYLHTVHADENGNFEIRHLPDGEYYITSIVNFTHWFWNSDATEKVTMQDSVPVYTQVTIKGGQTVRITDWNYGRQTSK